MKRKTKQCKIYIEDWNWLHQKKGTIAEVLHTLLTARKDILKELVAEYMDQQIKPYVAEKMQEIEEKLSNRK